MRTLAALSLAAVIGLVGCLTVTSTVQAEGYQPYASKMTKKGYTKCYYDYTFTYSCHSWGNW
jgi:hypothetical protein